MQKLKYIQPFIHNNQRTVIDHDVSRCAVIAGIWQYGWDRQWPPKPEGPENQQPDRNTEQQILFQT